MLHLDAASGSLAEASLGRGNGLRMVMTGFHEKPLLLTRDVSPGHFGSSPRSSRSRSCPRAPRPADGFKIHVIGLANLRPGYAQPAVSQTGHPVVSLTGALPHLKCYRGPTRCLI
jgi:hypothetical protein